jgi:RNA polymerase sigma factor (sigma-70 family)
VVATAPAEHAWTLECEHVAHKAVGGYFLPGGEHADLVQEARIGVLKATRTFRVGSGDFGGWAFRCARAAVIDAVHAATCGKHGPLNYGLRLDGPPHQSDDESCTLGDAVPGGQDPAEIAEAREELARVLAICEHLSPLEFDCITRVRLGGEPYTAIGEHKRVDNAMQRATAKLRAAA